jgi:cathepsin F
MLSQICKTFVGGFICSEEMDYGLEQRFQQHMSEFGLSYGTKEEYNFRMEIFADNDAYIREQNLNSENTFVLDHNKFSTMTKEEVKMMLGKKDPIAENATVEELPTDNLSAAIDWRSKGAVNAVQDQG